MMIKFLKVSLVLFAGLFISCNKDSADTTVPVVPYTTQYPKDEAKIEAYLLGYHMEVNATTKDVEFTALPANNPPVGDPGHIKSIREEFIDVDLPNRVKTVRKHAVDYKIYYIPLDEGVGSKPTRVDSILVAYKGRLLDEGVTTFDSAFNPVWLRLPEVVLGWREIIPLFKTGNHTVNGDGTINYSDFGAGVMFLPSGMGYYNLSQAGIPAYSPLIFNFKLMKLNYIDNDFDGISSIDEDLNGNGIYNDDDSDGDGKSNYLDQDDDGDGYLTKYEITKPTGGLYDFADIPTCGDGKKKHLSKQCH